ncbi:hypothetical protein TgHK011_000252 [Trichoderma gracile]|nr:hypothetical protein TgHK011_000252 [Trichoderma gracile]
MAQAFLDRPELLAIEAEAVRWSCAHHEHTTLTNKMRMSAATTLQFNDRTGSRWRRSFGRDALAVGLASRHQAGCRITAKAVRPD